MKASAQIPLYGGRIRILVIPETEMGTLWDSIFKSKRKAKPDDYCYAFSYYEGCTATMVFGKASIGTGTISHEARHAVELIMKNIGTRVCGATSEPCAYLEQWIVEWVGKQLERKKVRLLHY